MLVTAYGLDAFLIPNRLAAGGVSGLATIIHYVAAPYAQIPVGVAMLVLNALLLILAWRARGWRYLARTVYGTVVLSLAIDLGAPFVHPLATNDPLLAALYGGAITGIGLGIVFKAGGNTGGTDIIAQLLVRARLARHRPAHAARGRVRHGDGGARVRPDARALRHRRRLRRRRGRSTSCRRASSVNKAAYIISDVSDAGRPTRS